MRPKVTVCLPSFNGSKYVAEAMASVLNQSFVDFEIVAVDDCSIDGTEEIVKSFKDKRIKYFRNSWHLGLVGNWNRCLELSRGEFICFLHQDDIMCNKNLETKVELLKTNPNVGLVYSKVIQINANGDIFDKNQIWSERSPSENFIKGGVEYFQMLVFGDNLICCPSVMTRNECFKKLGTFDYRLPFTADWEMWMRIALHYDVAYLAEPLVRYRWHDENETYNYSGNVIELEQYYRAKRIILEKFPNRIPDFSRLKKKIEKDYAVSAVGLAHHCHRRHQCKEAVRLLAFAARIQPMILIRRDTVRLLAKLILGRRAAESLVAGKDAGRNYE